MCWGTGGSDFEMRRSGAGSAAGWEDGVGSGKGAMLGVRGDCDALWAMLLLTPSGKMELSSFSSKVPL